MGTGGGGMGGVEKFQVASWDRKQDTLQPAVPLGQYADFTLYLIATEDTQFGMIINKK